MDFNSTKSYVDATTKYNYDTVNHKMEVDSTGVAIKTLLTTGSGFIPIGILPKTGESQYDYDWDKGFKGSFDGDEHTIYNLFINVKEDVDYGGMRHAGLFGYISYFKNETPARITNLSVSGNITSSYKYTDRIRRNCW